MKKYIRRATLACLTLADSYHLAGHEVVAKKIMRYVLKDLRRSSALGKPVQHISFKRISLRHTLSINSLFSWQRTEEGRDYWLRVHQLKVDLVKVPD